MNLCVGETFDKMFRAAFILFVCGFVVVFCEESSRPLTGIIPFEISEEVEASFVGNHFLQLFFNADHPVCVDVCKLNRPEFEKYCTDDAIPVFLSCNVDPKVVDELQNVPTEPTSWGDVLVMSFLTYVVVGSFLLIISGSLFYAFCVRGSRASRGRAPRRREYEEIEGEAIEMTPIRTET